MLFQNLGEGNMSRFIFNLGRIKRHIGRLKHVIFKGPSIIAHAECAYHLASTLPTPVIEESTVWLSIIVPVYNSNLDHLNVMLASFENQTRQGVELILVDDASPNEIVGQFLDGLDVRDGVQILRRDTNGGVAAAIQTGLNAATGDLVTFLEHHDVIAPHTFKVIWQAFQKQPDLQFLYTDELIIDVNGRFIDHITKPAFDPVLLSGMNYINHFSIFRRNRLLSIGGMRSAFGGSQDYDLVLRYTRHLEDREIVHLPYPAYWWRHGESNFSIKNARNALTEHFAAKGHEVTVSQGVSPIVHRPQFAHPKNGWPFISVIIPSKNGIQLIRQTLEGLFERTDYPNFEVLLIDNGSDDPAVFDLYREYNEKFDNFSAYIKAEPFNFSRSINRGLGFAKDGDVLLLNNDIEVIEAGWLKELVSCLTYDDVGIVGAKLLFPDDTIQHAGVIVGQNGIAGHWFYKEKENYDGPMKRLHVRQSLSCITGAVMLISKECRHALGPWSEDNFAIAFNDVDYCLRAHKAGFRIVWTPFAKLYHHESATRGPEKDSQKASRLKREKEALKNRHRTQLYDDPAFSPWFSKTSSRIKFRRLDKLPESRTWWLSDNDDLGPQ